MSTVNIGQQIENPVDSLYNWVLKNQYYGWDIYDGLNSPLTQKITNPYLRILLLQINKYSPINMRKILKVKKGIDVKGIALFAQSYATLYSVTGEEKYLSEMKKAIDFIKEKSLREKYGYDCWASHYYPYITLGKSTLSVDVPDIIGTGQATIALIKSYNITKNSEEKDIAISAAEFIVNELFQNDDKYPFFAYSKSDDNPKHITLNASAQAMEALCALNIGDNEKYKSVCESAAQTLIQTQNNDGSWDYSIHKDGSKKRTQLDFHQGYIIDGLLAFLPHSHNKNEIIECIIKASDYYNNIMFRKDGRSYFRYPLAYPIDIHNQAQGIISFSKLTWLDNKYADFAEKIINWTVCNMQDNSGYFYYQKWPFITNKIPHMRWGQAWMMRALSTYLEKSSGGFND
ncbi:MAG: hypothetical protein PHG79_04230 [Methanosarcina sp.]|nr:hypothetical protein [Methanosarcina sp.]MDD4522476.1 hypothetical protein [Methanosarcina sp.]